MVNTQGAKPFDLVPDAIGGWKGSDVVSVGVNPNNEFRAVFTVPGVYGNVAIYAGQEFTFQGSPPDGVPFQIDWRLHHGVNFCLWDEEPVAAASTIFPAGVGSDGLVSRQGMLFQLDGTHARSYVLLGRLRGITATARISMSVHVLPSSFGPPFAATVGSFAG